MDNTKTIQEQNTNPNKIGFKEAFGYMLGDAGNLFVLTYVSSFLKDIDHIEITISLVNNTVTVPNFNGKSYLDALNFCNKNGFVLEAIFIPSSLDRNTIIYQEIEPNSILYKNSGTRLTFYVAK